MFHQATGGQANGNIPSLHVIPPAKNPTPTLQIKSKAVTAVQCTAAAVKNENNASHLLPCQGEPFHSGIVFFDWALKNFLRNEQ